MGRHDQRRPIVKQSFPPLLIVKHETLLSQRRLFVDSGITGLSPDSYDGLQHISPGQCYHSQSLIHKLVLLCSVESVLGAPPS